MKRVKFEMEFIFRASPAILYKFLTDPSCLIRWFCDEIDIEGDEYVFTWEGSDEIALLIDDIEEERLKFKWDDADDPKEFFEFRMYRSEVTAETILEIVDFADDGDVQYQKSLWETQIKQLRQETGG